MNNTPTEPQTSPALQTSPASLTSPPSDLLPVGTKLMWYRIELVLGRGGFAVTYLVQDQHLKQRFAIKEYLPAGLAHRHGTEVSAKPGCEKDFIWGRERFLAEAQTLARFKHPNIVRVVSFFEANNTAYLVMDFEEGESLAQFLGDHPAVSESALLAIMLPLMDGLEMLHREGFIHRDIKPENVYLRRDGTPVLLDFGAARQALGGQTQNLTALLSPGYAPLEQYFCQKDRQGPWSDIYALGAVMYRIIGGKKPPEASLRSNYQINALADPLTPASQLGLGRYSPGLLNAIDHSLRLREAERPQTLTEWRGMMKNPAAGGTSGTSGTSGMSGTPAAALLAAENTTLLRRPNAVASEQVSSRRTTTTRPATRLQRTEQESGGGKRWLIALVVILALGIAYKTLRPAAKVPAPITPPPPSLPAMPAPAARIAVPPEPAAPDRSPPEAPEAPQREPAAPEENRPPTAPTGENRPSAAERPGGTAIDQTKRACRAEIEAYCPNLVPGDGRFAACARDNAHRLSADCRSLVIDRLRPRPPRN